MSASGSICAAAANPTASSVTSTASRSSIYIVAELDGWEGEDRVFSRNWQRRIPRADV
jgi:hypothetical protein